MVQNSKNPLVGLVYHQFKNGKVFEVTFPHSIKQSQRRDATLYAFDIKELGNNDYSKFNVYLTGTLAVEKNEFEKNVIVTRGLYKLLNSGSIDLTITTNNFDTFFNASENKIDHIRYLILKYAADRFELLFDKKFFSIEFIGAINTNPETIIYQLRYLSKHSMIRFEPSIEHMEHQFETIDYLNQRMVLDVESKHEIIEYIRNYESKQNIPEQTKFPNSNTAQESVTEQVNIKSDTEVYKPLNLESLLQKDDLGAFRLFIDLWPSKPLIGQRIPPNILKNVAQFVGGAQDLIIMQDKDFVIATEMTGEVSGPKSFSIKPGLLDINKLSIILYDYQFEDSPFYFSDSGAFAVIGQILSLVEMEPDLRHEHCIAYFISFILLRIHSKFKYNIDIKPYEDSSAYRYDELAKQIMTGKLAFRTSNALSDLKNSKSQFDKELASSIEEILDKIKTYYASRPGTKPKVEQGDVLVEPPPITLETSGKDPDVVITHSIPSGLLPAATELRNTDDALNYSTYAEAFAKLITHPKTETPLTIGICGPWGRGKTKLFDLIKKEIKENNNQSNLECCIINFNAWKYSKAEDIWIAFYAEVLKGIEREIGFFQRFLLRWSVFWGTFKKSRPKYFILRMTSFIIFLAILIFYLIGYFKIGKNIITDLNWTTWAPVFVAIVSLITFLWDSFFSISKTILGRFKASEVKQKPSLQDEVFCYFESVCSWLDKKLDKYKKKKNQNNQFPQRIIVFIDDIDRCASEKIIQILEAIKLFLEEKNFVFLLAMDAKVARMAVGANYEFISLEPEQKERWGRYYLEKIVQIPFALPQPSPEDMLNMKNYLLKNNIEQEKQIDVDEPLLAKKTKDEKVEASLEPDSKKSESAILPDEKNIKTKTPETIGPTKESKDNLDVIISLNKALDMKLTKDEDSTLNDLINYRLNLSPRQIIQLTNVYLIARYLYLEDKNELPETILLKWLAISIRYPFETRDLIKLRQYPDWDDWSKAKNELLDFYTRKAVKRQSELDFELKRNISEMIWQLDNHIRKPLNLQNYLKYANLFNLVLD